MGIGYKTRRGGAGGGGGVAVIKSFQKISYTVSAGSLVDLPIATVVPANCKAVVRYKSGNLFIGVNDYFHTAIVTGVNTVRLQRGDASATRNVVIEITEYEELESNQVITSTLAVSSTVRNIAVSSVIIANSVVVPAFESGNVFGIGGSDYRGQLDFVALTTPTNLFIDELPRSESYTNRIQIIEFKGA
jgi:hypothetical protein